MDLMTGGSVVLGFACVLRIIKVMYAFCFMGGIKNHESKRGEKSMPKYDKKVDKKMLLKERSNKRLPVKKSSHPPASS